MSNNISIEAGVIGINNQTIGLAEYDQYFVDWRNFDFRIRANAPRTDVGANQPSGLGT